MAATNNTSGHTGVHWDKANSGWKAHIIAYGIYISLGQYKTKDEAIAARVAGVQEVGRHDYPYGA